MNIFVIGGGGREHALIDALGKSRTVSKLYCAPGNAGIARSAECVALSPDDSQGILRFAQEKDIALTVVGPEQPLVNGIVDVFRSAGRRIFGPTGSAARLEGSKAYAKDFMTRYNIPTARAKTFTPDNADRADAFIRSLPLPVVVKADGLAAGKGVIICDSHSDASGHVREMLSGRSFGAAGRVVVVEEFLRGQEASVFVLTDGTSFKVLPAAQDHKRVFDGDNGKNTGGMGAYAPAPVMTASLSRVVEDTIVRPTLDGMRADGIPYTGCLFVGLMLTENGPRVLEYNCRFGDPETQVVVPLLDCDLAKIFEDIAEGSFDPSAIRFRDASAVCVVMASGGYPDAFDKGKKVEGLEVVEKMEDVKVYHAGTALVNGEVRTSGGRVLGVTAFGPREDIRTTIAKAYGAVSRISFEKAHYRKDIGHRAIVAQ